MRPSAALAGLIVLVAILTGPLVARAHQSSLTHSEVTVDGADVRWSMLASPPDLAEALGRPADEAPSDEALAAGAAQLVAYVTARVSTRDGETPCPAQGGAVDVVADGGARFARIAWTARCPAPVEELVITYDLFFDLDPTHEAVVRVAARGDATDTVLRDGAARLVWELGEPPPSGTWAFLRSGVDHIVYGFDHIAFVLALLLTIGIRRAPAGGWERKRLGAALRDTALIVTSFTLAHSITLIAASLGWVSVPGRLVEIVIALSIAYTAVENVVRPDARWRFALTFAFGLLHGLGFARMLEVLLPPDDVVVPLLAFNLGVELGQLAIVAVALPAFWALAGAIGPGPYRRQAMPILSLALAALGLAWLAERVLDVTILGF